ncbi:protein of unknown function [Candidatus Filomicrobium marinum]|uniref:Uncharacterized protein n=2 Tax=Filomicrobium TaxID=119044 RepID=A0A0D6JH33_9HYPH|nr:protein of unknown function [Candidatus Filomicrobium marinum]CPR20573.1 protein of unknown function [Candidatus Filomicrobium marinum]SDP16085.1 hypothetical protein SAMN04488061_2358 [Filomicrobium insigne]
MRAYLALCVQARLPGKRRSSQTHQNVEPDLFYMISGAQLGLGLRRRSRKRNEKNSNRMQALTIDVHNCRQT